MKKMFLHTCVILLAVIAVNCLDNGLGKTPPMGWNSWNHFGCKISEQLIKKTADLLVSTGLAKKGYKYLNLDDCWQISRDQKTGQIIEDKSKFPSGIKQLAKYVHDQGLLFGLYSDAGEKTCEGRPGGWQHQQIDAKTYAEWEVDYLKYDNCYNLNISGKTRYFVMKKALNESGRHIFYSMCNWGQQESWKWAKDYANSWRTTGDIQDNWKSMIGILDKQAQNGVSSYSGPGGWNDPDMLEVGNGGMTKHQYQAHFALWCLLKSPLLIGCSLQNITQQTLQILGNEQLIAINQDALGVQGNRVRPQDSPGSHQVWSGPLSGNRTIVIFLNKEEVPGKISIDIKTQLHLDIPRYTLRDVINHQDLGEYWDDDITYTVPSHAVIAFIITPVKAQTSFQRLRAQLQ